MAIVQTCLPRVAPFRACKAKARLAAPSGLRQHCVIRAALLPEHEEKNSISVFSTSSRLAFAGVLASGLLCTSPLPAKADIQVVSPQVVTQMARPLPKQTVDKGKVWTVFIGGAVLLFGATVVLENNEKFFPAITQANRSFRAAAKQIDEMEERQRKEEELLRLRQTQYDEEQRQLALVEAGMREARAKVLGTTTAGSGPVAALTQAAAPVNNAAAQQESHSQPIVVQAANNESSTVVDANATPYVVIDDTVPNMGAMAWPAASATAAASAAPAAPAPAPALPSTSAHSDLEASPQVTPAANRSATPSDSSDVTSAAEDAESMARLSRLRGFVSGTMTGSQSPLEAYKAQRQ